MKFWHKVLILNKDEINTLIVHKALSVNQLWLMTQFWERFLIHIYKHKFWKYLFCLTSTDITIIHDTTSFFCIEYICSCTGHRVHLACGWLPTSHAYRIRQNKTIFVPNLIFATLSMPYHGRSPGQVKSKFMIELWEASNVSLGVIQNRRSVSLSGVFGDPGVYDGVGDSIIIVIMIPSSPTHYGHTSGIT